MSLWSAIKSALQFPAWGGQGISRGGIDPWIWAHGGQGYDFVEAAGDFHKNGVVMACVCWIMRAFPEAILQVFRETTVAGEESAVQKGAVPNHPLTKALLEPNPFYVGDNLWQRVLFDRSLHGQGFIYKMRNYSGKVISLWHIPQHRLIPQWDKDGKEFITHYQLIVDARWTRIETRDLVRFGFAADPERERMGMAAVGAGIREVASLNEGANYRGSILHGMGVPSHLLQSKDLNRPINQEQATYLHTLWEQRVSGNQRGRPLIPNFPLEATKLGFSPKELDIGPMQNWDADLVHALFGVSSMVTGISSGSEHKTYANYKEAREAATENALIPVWKQMGQELTQQLLYEYSTDKTEKVEFDTSKVRSLQEDQTAIWGRVDKSIVSGWVQINEGRAIVGLPPIPGGDVFLPARGEEPLYLGQSPIPAPQSEQYGAQARQEVAQESGIIARQDAEARHPVSTNGKK